MLYNVLLLSLLFFALLFSRMKQTEQSKKLFLMICIMMLGTVSACRFEGGSSDFQRNYKGFVRVSSMNWAEIFSTGEEVGHLVLRKLISVTLAHPQYYFAITGFFIVISYAIFCYRLTPNIYFGLLLFFLVSGYFESHNTTRQFIAVCICLFAIKYVITQRFGPFCMLVLLAMTMHLSSIVFFPVYFLSRIQFSKKSLLIYLAFTFIFYFAFANILTYIQQFVYDDFVEGSYGTKASNSLRMVIPTMIMIILLFGKKARTRALSTWCGGNEKLAIQANSFISHTTMIFFVCNVLSTTKMLMMSRVAHYFWPGTIMLILFTIHGLSQKQKRLSYLMVFFVSIVWFLINNSFGRLIPTPYIPFWEYV